MLQIDVLIELLRGIKSLGFATKIDSNGYFPENIKKLLDEKLLDYVAIDVKTLFEPETYGLVIGLPNAGNEAIQRIKESLKLLIDSGISLEVRTTIVPGLIEKEKEIELLAKDIQGVSLYVLQQFRPSEGTLNPKYENLPYPSRKQLLELAKIAKKYLCDVRIRTIEKGEERVLG